MELAGNASDNRQTPLEFEKDKRQSQRDRSSDNQRARSLDDLKDDRNISQKDFQKKSLDAPKKIRNSIKPIQIEEVSVEPKVSKLERIVTADESEIDLVLSNLCSEFDIELSQSRPTSPFLPIAPARNPVNQKKLSLQSALHIIDRSNSSINDSSSSEGCHDERISYSCSDCKLIIVGKNVKLSESIIFHPDHFKCQAQRQKISGLSKCGKILSLKSYFEHDLLYYCTQCHLDFITPKCEYCSMSIKDVINFIFNLFLELHSCTWKDFSRIPFLLCHMR